MVEFFQKKKGNERDKKEKRGSGGGKRRGMSDPFLANERSGNEKEGPSSKEKGSSRCPEKGKARKDQCPLVVKKPL